MIDRNENKKYSKKDMLSKRKGETESPLGQKRTNNHFSIDSSLCR